MLGLASSILGERHSDEKRRRTVCKPPALDLLNFVLALVAGSILIDYHIIRRYPTD